MQASMLAWVVTYLVHSTLLVLGAWLLERRWGDRPERMSAVWKTALVGGLVTATVQTGLGIAPMAGRWDLSPVLASREPGASAGAEAVTAPAEAPAAAPPAPVLATASSSWPPPTAGLDVERERLEAGAVIAAEREVADAREIIVARTEPALAIAAAPVVPGERELVVAEAEREPMLAVASVGAVPPSASSSAEASAPAPSAWIAVVPWLMAILVLGALLGLASVLVAFAALRRQLAGRHPLGEGTLATLLEGLRRRAGIGRPVRLTVAPRVQVPMAVGVLRPEIVVPPKAAQGLPPAHQESLLAHELAHVLRRDPAWRLAALLVERVFFFQPLNRLASRRVAQSAEYLCDDWAARHTRQPLALASCLTEIATWVARTGPVPATMAGPRSILGRRVQRLLQPARTSARPWWLSAALGLPLLGVVAVAPGVGTQAHAKGDRKGAERIVVIDEDGRRHEVRPTEGGAIVVQERDGELVVRSLDERTAPAVAGDEASPREARKAAREQERARDKARREARKELRRAFRAAKARGEAAPSRAEVEAILRRARVASGSEPEHVDVRVVVPGHVALHGRVPVDVEAIEDGIEEGVEGALEGLRALEALEGLEHLEGIEGLEELGPALEEIQRELEGLEDLGPMLEELEEQLEAEGLDVVIVQPDGGHPRVRVLTPEQARALHDADRMRHLAERERARADRHRGEHHAEARREAQREAMRMRQEAMRMREELRRGRGEHDAAREDAKRMQKEAIRREIERAHRERMRQAPSELPTVWVPAPEAPMAWSEPMPVPEAWAFPVPAPAPEPPPAPPAPRVRRTKERPVAPGAPVMVRGKTLRKVPPAPPAPMPPRAPLPPAAPSAPTPPAAPQPDVGPVVWVSWPPPTTAIGHVTTAC